MTSRTAPQLPADGSAPGGFLASRVRIAFAVVLGLVLAVAVPITARAAPDPAASARAFTAKLKQFKASPRFSSSLVDVDALGQAFLEQLKGWLEKNYPLGGNPQFDQVFEENLRARIDALSSTDVSAMREPNADVFQRRLDVMFGTVAMFTVAHDEVLLADRSKPKWRRRDQAGGPRQWSTYTPNQKPELAWKRWEDVYRALDGKWTADRTTPLRAVYGQPADVTDEARAEWLSAIADVPPAEWRAQFTAHLKQTYADLGMPLTDALAQDLGRLWHLLSGFTKENGEVVPVGLADLAPLERRLRAAPRIPLADILRAEEVAEGFVREHVVPIGPLAPDQFLTLVNGGYTPDDVGVGPDHGADTHRLQLNMFINNFRAHPGEYEHPPLELYTTIGAIDRQSLRQLFGFERPALLWDRIFDSLEDPNIEILSRPEQMFDLLSESEGLDELTRRLQERYDNIFAIGERLLETARSSSTTDDLNLDAIRIRDVGVQAVIQEQYDDYLDATEIDQPDELETLLTSLYQEDYFADAREAGYDKLSMPDGTGSTQAVLVLRRGGGVIDPANFATELGPQLARQKRRHTLRRISTQRDPAAAGGDSATASTSTRRVADEDLQLAADAEPAARLASDGPADDASSGDADPTDDETDVGAVVETGRFEANAFPDVPTDAFDDDVAQDQTVGRPARVAGAPEQDDDDEEDSGQGKKKRRIEQPQEERVGEPSP